MTSRRYRTTRPLVAQVSLILRRFGVEEVATPTTGALIALYVAGLILLDGRQTQTRVALFLPGRAHDALNRLLRVMPLCTRALMRLLIAWVGRRRRQEGYLCLDDVVVEKTFARKLPWAAWTYSFAKKRKVCGLHVVELLWCDYDGSSRIPVAFRLWRPKRSCAARLPHQAPAGGSHAQGGHRLGLEARYIVFDTHYSAGWFTRMGLVWVGTLHPRTILYWRGERCVAGELAGMLPLKW
jgi:DDE superfamily endonuclease